MTFEEAERVELAIPRKALEAVFDECDRHDAEETGGRLIGTFGEAGGVLRIAVTGIIGPGHEAKRSAVYLMQDGAYQERVFRKVEDLVPSIEHLGTWHTHHMNGLRHLSAGDLATYRRTVNHANHNIDFFCAVLVTDKLQVGAGQARYAFKAYLFRRGDPKAYEIPERSVALTDDELVWPRPAEVQARGGEPEGDEEAARRNRAFDGDAVASFFPNVKAFRSGRLGVYWRGSIELVDGTDLGVVVTENAGDGAPDFSLTVVDVPEALAGPAGVLAGEVFPSCRSALLGAERRFNAELYRNRTRRRVKRWTF